MKCDDCLNLLAEYIDGEVIERDAERLSAHLMTCTGCASEFESLTTEQDMFARYDRELSITPAMWSAIQARTVTESRSDDARAKLKPLAWLAGLFATPRLGFAYSGAMAVLIAAVVIGFIYLKTHPRLPTTEVASTVKPGSVPPPPIYSTAPTAPVKAPGAQVNGASDAGPVVASYVPPVKKTPKRTGGPGKPDDPGVLFTDIAYSDLAEKDTAEHIQQAENLLRSIRSLQDSDDNSEIDVSYEKAMSRRLLSENVVLRGDAEKAGKFPTKELLGDLEPFLIDISNLPDKTTPDKLRAIKDRVQTTEIVAALVSY
jgi:Putative zinc-finger